MDLLEHMKRKHTSMDFVELDCADLGVASHRNRVVAGSEVLIAALRRTSRYGKRYGSIADAFSQAKQEMRGTFVRLGTIAATAPAGAKRRNCKSAEERCNTLTTRLCLSWASNPRDTGDEFALRAFTIEEAAIVAGLPASFKLGEKRAVARRLIGAATPPALLRVLLHNYSSRVVVEEDDDPSEVHACVRSLRECCAPCCAAVAPSISTTLTGHPTLSTAGARRPRPHPLVAQAVVHTRRLALPCTADAQRDHAR